MDKKRLEQKIAEVRQLTDTGIISGDKAKAWIDKLIDEYERTGLIESGSSQSKSGMPSDLAHFPGRLVAGLIHGLDTMSKNTANRIEEIERENHKKSNR